MTDVQAAPVALILNAGGASRRMGMPKALLEVPGTGQPLILYIAERLEHVIDGPILVVANDPAIEAIVEKALPGSLRSDRWTDAGALGGIATGLTEIEGWAVVVACDMPFVRPEVVRLLIDAAHERDRSGAYRWDAVVPVVSGYQQTLHALYHRRCLDYMVDQIGIGDVQVRSIFDRIRVRYVGEDLLRPLDPSLDSFVNVNTPQEWQAAVAHMK